MNKFKAPRSPQDIVDKEQFLMSSNQDSIKVDLWHKAVLQECMSVQGCYKESDPVGTIRSLLDWHCKNTENNLDIKLAGFYDPKAKDLKGAFVFSSDYPEGANECIVPLYLTNKTI
jgi:hypothetical protein